MAKKLFRRPSSMYQLASNAPTGLAIFVILGLSVTDWQLLLCMRRHSSYARCHTISTPGKLSYHEDPKADAIPRAHYGRAYPKPAFSKRAWLRHGWALEVLILFSLDFWKLAAQESAWQERGINPKDIKWESSLFWGIRALSLGW